MISSISYNGYIIDVFETKRDYRYVITKDEKKILESATGWPFPHEAEMQAKLYINRVESRSKENKSGWTIS
jgi:hypothetical protein